MSIKRYNEFINEEESYLKKVVISLATMLSMGLTRSQVEVVKNDTTKLSIINSIINYNKNPEGIDTLKYHLTTKVKEPDSFIQDYLRVLPDRTVVVKPNFISGLELKANPFNNTFNVSYTIKF